MIHSSYIYLYFSFELWVEMAAQRVDPEGAIRVDVTFVM